ncbi:MAG: outer membrane beta-barrel protein [Saprospiraceae bacterium]|nr:outer membrane beta-barrel protein [Saprospiraceae bacterium]MBP9195702.1 outer membrane beta-barrel protein [Saprospiraceae bacterium]
MIRKSCPVALIVIDHSWANGSDCRKESIWNGSPYFTPSVILDINYTYSFSRPIDNTVVGSTALARNNEFQSSALHFGGDFQYKGARARFMTQLGTRSVVVPRNDYSPYRGQYALATAYQYLSEAYAGYHWNKWDGINVDVGLFMSYIGLNYSTNLDYMPNQSLTFRVEYVSRHASVPYFAGRGGVASPNGYTTSLPGADWRPDLVKSVSRMIMVVLFRI